MEATPTETQGTATGRSFDLDAMGLGPPTRTRRRGKIDKWTRILGVAVVLLLVFNIGVRMGHGSRPKATAPVAGAGSAVPGAQAGAGAGTGAPPADGAAKPAASGTVK